MGGEFTKGLGERVGGATTSTADAGNRSSEIALFRKQLHCNGTDVNNERHFRTQSPKSPNINSASLHFKKLDFSSHIFIGVICVLSDYKTVLENPVQSTTICLSVSRIYYLMNRRVV
jgi:hypothetical protein